MNCILLESEGDVEAGGRWDMAPCIRDENEFGRCIARCVDWLSKGEEERTDSRDIESESEKRADMLSSSTARANGEKKASS